MELVPEFVQAGPGPHLSGLVYLCDADGDAFASGVKLRREGVVVPDAPRPARFSVHARWNVEGYGYVFLAADNEGEGYPRGDARRLSLNRELARSRVAANRLRMTALSGDGWTPPREATEPADRAATLLVEAERATGTRRATLFQESLRDALVSGDALELARVRHDAARRGPRDDFHFGCDGRGIFQMDRELFLDRFSAAFDYATVTHYLAGDVHNFEREEGALRFAERDQAVDALRARGCIVEGRPLFWSHAWVTPAWLREKTYPQILRYLERHVREVVGHYGSRLAVWEVVNELHDWANELGLDREQTVEIASRACGWAREVNPGIKLLVNNCCLFGDYVQFAGPGVAGIGDAKPPDRRTPYRFVRDLVEAGVDFDIVGLQVYYGHRSPQDLIRLLERFQCLGKTIHLTEVGAVSRGLSRDFSQPEADPANEPCEWRRYWDEELQADWMEYCFAWAYGNPRVEAASWYDFVDPHAYLRHGGMLRSPAGEPKAAYDRLRALRRHWTSRPAVPA